MDARQAFARRRFRARLRKIRARRNARLAGDSGDSGADSRRRGARLGGGCERAGIVVVAPVMVFAMWGWFADFLNTCDAAWQAVAHAGLMADVWLAFIVASVWYSLSE